MDDVFALNWPVELGGRLSDDILDHLTISIQIYRLADAFIWHIVDIVKLIEGSSVTRLDIVVPLLLLASGFSVIFCLLLESS